MKKALFIIFIFFNAMAYSQTRRVLFIGNSYTINNDLPQIVKDLAGSVGDNLIYSMSAFGSYELKLHSTNTSTLNLIRQGGWDKAVPKGRMSQDLTYTYALFHRLSRYHLDGRYRIDNNLVENTIRPLAR